MISAQAREAVRAIADTRGGLITPDAVVRAARSPSSPLHALFTWDNRKAAHAHRLNEARMLIRSVMVTVSERSIVFDVPQYLRDPRVGKDQGYASISAIKSDDDVARSVMIAEFSRAANALKRARVIAQAIGQVDEVDGILRQIEALISRNEQRPDLAD